MMKTMKGNKNLFRRQGLSFVGSCILMLLPVVVLAQDCAFESQLDFSLPSSALKQVAISAGAGALHVVGSATATEVRVRGRLCAARQEQLAQMGIGHVVQEGVLYVSTKMATTYGGFLSSRDSTIDLEIEVPAGMQTRVTDGSGATTISGTGDLEVVDGSGSLTIFAIAGNVTVEDGSGELRIDGVQGDVAVDDGSGAMFIAKVSGALTVRDGSGDINVHEIGRAFSVLSDGSGDVNVDRDMHYTTTGSLSANLD